MVRKGWLLASLALLAGVLLHPALARADTPIPSGERVLRMQDPDDSDEPPAKSLPAPAQSLLDAARMPTAEFPTETLAKFTDDDVYHRGQWSVSYMTGYYGINLGPAPVPFSMLPELVRFNRVYNDWRPNKLLRGTFEWVFELDTLPVVNGPASIVIGGSALLRYNYYTPRIRQLVFYTQMGGGGMYTDAYLFRRMVLTTGFEFIINFGAGANYFITDRLALTAEWSYVHFSNGGMALPNIGINQMGGLIGLTYYFKRR